MELETFKKTLLPLRERLISFSQKIVEDYADAEDVAQETFLKLWSIRDKLDEYESVEALAMRITKNVSLDRLKIRKQRATEQETYSITSDRETPDKQLEQRDAVIVIRRLIESLPTLQQTIIRMKDVEGYELSEIAEITGTPVENVRVNLSRARKRVRERFLRVNQINNR